jgi:predicted CoA-binding protein
MTGRDLSDEELFGIYRSARTIAVVGASANEAKAAHTIPAYLHSQGYRIVPVSPRGGEMYGERVHPSLDSIEGPVDVVDVFRPSREAEAVAQDAVAIGVPVLWFQPGTDTPEAVAIASEAGLTVVTGRCMGDTHARLGLGSGPVRPTPR